jgi:hypothetical protein
VGATPIRCSSPVRHGWLTLYSRANCEQTNADTLSYLEALSQGIDGELPLEELVTLARAIFSETMEHDQTVGGDVQMAVIPSRGEAEWMLKLSSSQGFCWAEPS